MADAAAMSAGPAALARVGVVVVNYNAGAWLRRCVESLRPPGSAHPDIVIVDNGSADDSLAGVDDSPARIDRAGRNLGFAAGVNRGAAGLSSDYLLLLNPDCRLTPAALAELVAELDRNPDAALVSGRVVGLDGAEQRASRRRLPTPARIRGELMPFGGVGIDLSTTPAPAEAVDVEAVSGACMLVRRQAFEAVDGMDEGFPLHFEDLDLCARLAAAGWRIRWTPAATIEHAGGRSTRTRPVAVLWAKHRGLWRYLRRHCDREWPVWQRPLWFALLAAHALARTPQAWWTRSRS
jgi:hypothetical protein